MNYCCKFVELLPEHQKIRFAENIEFLLNILLKFKFDIFVDMFSQNTFNSKLINENFISYCKSIMLIDSTYCKLQTANCNCKPIEFVLKSEISIKSLNLKKKQLSILLITNTVKFVSLGEIIESDKQLLNTNS